MLKIKISWLICVTFTFSFVASQEYNNDTFPPWFKFGAATSAYQIEGGWNQNGKGPSIWDTYTHEHRNLIVDHTTGDVACDSYHKFKEDIELAEYMGIDFYRFSISWARILPYGYVNKYINEPGIQFYNDVIDLLISKNITPMVTMYHWDLPQELQNIGGWPNPLIAEIFGDYARLLFQRFGDRVKIWLTINEPRNICAVGYGTIWLAPGVNQSGIADYLCGQTVLLAHATAYHIYKDEFQETQKGQITITMGTTWYQAAENDTADKEAQFRKLMWSFGWFANPIYGNGNYPQVMIDRIGNRSAEEGFPRSRLPVLTPEQQKFIRGTYDFMSLNMYTSALVAPEPPNPRDQLISLYNDCGVEFWQPAWWPGSSDPWLKVTPWGAYDTLVWIKNYYGDFKIVITENGYADKGELKDYKRIQYIKEYLNAIRNAMVVDRVDVVAYSVWSLIDNFEWTWGYTQKFGLNYVNFSRPDRPRKHKNSARCYKKLIRTHEIDWDCTGDANEDYDIY